MRNSLLVFAFVGFLMCGNAARAQSELLAYNTAAVSSAYTFPGQDEGASIVFYPNPVRDYLNVRFPQRGNYTVRVYNIVGEKIAEKSVMEDNIVRMNLSELTAGMYFVSYEYGGKVLTKTFSKAE